MPKWPQETHESAQRSKESTAVGSFTAKFRMAWNVLSVVQVSGFTVKSVDPAGAEQQAIRHRVLFGFATRNGGIGDAYFYFIVQSAVGMEYLGQGQLVDPNMPIN